MIGGLPEPNVIPADSLEPGTQDMPVTGDEKGKIIEEDNVSVKGGNLSMNHYTNP